MDDGEVTFMQILGAPEKECQVVPTYKTEGEQSRRDLFSVQVLEQWRTMFGDVDDSN